MAFSKIKGFEKFATKPKNVAVITIDKKYPALTKSFKNFGNLEIEELRNINPVSILNHKYLVSDLSKAKIIKKHNLTIVNIGHQIKWDKLKIRDVTKFIINKDLILDKIKDWIIPVKHNFLKVD